MRRAVGHVDVAASERRKRQRRAAALSMSSQNNNTDSSSSVVHYGADNEARRVPSTTATTMATAVHHTTVPDDDDSDGDMRRSGSNGSGSDSGGSVESALWADEYVDLVDDDDDDVSDDDVSDDDDVVVSSPPDAATHGASTQQQQQQNSGSARPRVPHDDDDDDDDVVMHVVQRRLRTVTPAARQCVAALQDDLRVYAAAERGVDELLRARQAMQARVRDVEQSCHSSDADAIATIATTGSTGTAASRAVMDVVRLNVGGEVFVVPVATLLAREAAHSYFAALVSAMTTTTTTTTTTTSAAHATQHRQRRRRRQRRWWCSGRKHARNDDGDDEGGDADKSTRADDDNDDNNDDDNDDNDDDDDDDDDAAVAVPVMPFVDASGAVFIDRDPDVFRCVLHYLRGYTHFAALDDSLLRRLRHDAQYFQLPGLLHLLGSSSSSNNSSSNANNNSSSTHYHGLGLSYTATTPTTTTTTAMSPPPPPPLQFVCGPGVNPERNRLRVVYGIAMVDHAPLVTGCHRIHYEIVKAEYVGVGVVSDQCTCTDQEFHKTANCCVYYMSGVFYSNFPHHRKEENLERMEDGAVVTVTLDLDHGVAEFTLRHSSKMVSIGTARKLRFAVAMKLSSRVRIVDDVEAARLRAAQMQNEHDRPLSATTTTAAASATTSTTTLVPPLAPSRAMAT